VFKLYSKGCQYALRALAYAVLEMGDNRFQAKEICERAGIPESFTRKVFQSLVQGGFLRAHRGPGGGYSLVRRPEEITVLDVIYAVEGEDTFDHCVMGLPECNDKNPCPLHHLWIDTKANLTEHLSNTNLRDVANVTASRKSIRPGKKTKKNT